MNNTAPLQRPQTAKANIERSETELVVDYPSQFEMSFGRRGQFFWRLFFQCLLFFSVAGGIYFSVRAFFLVGPLFFEFFNPAKALLFTTLTVGCVSGVAFSFFLMSWASANMYASRWTLRIDRNKITLTTRAFFSTKQTEAERSEETRAESVKENYGFNWRKWLQIRYWLDAEPAWSGHHFQLTTDPAIPFPFHNAEEQEWLLRLINDFLQQSR